MEYSKGEDKSKVILGKGGYMDDEKEFGNPPMSGHVEDKSEPCCSEPHLASLGCFLERTDDESKAGADTGNRLDQEALGSCSHMASDLGAGLRALERRPLHVHCSWFV
jgi:hypothetical protein